MESYKGNDIKSLYRKVKGCNFKLPEGIRPGVEGLMSAFDTLTYVADERKVQETARKICCVLDSVRFKCLQNGYNEALSTGNGYLAQICRNQLMEYSKEKNKNNCHPTAGRSGVNQQRTVTPCVKSFPFAESLLNNTDYIPINNNCAFNQGVVNPRQTGHWSLTSKLLDEARNERLLTNPVLKKTTVIEKNPVIDSLKRYDKENIETNTVSSDVQFRPVFPTSNENNGVYKQSYLKKLSGSSQIGTARANIDGMKDVNNLLSKNSSRSDANKGENIINKDVSKRPVSKNFSKPMDSRRANVRLTPKKKESTPVSSRNLNRSSTKKKSRNISSLTNRKNESDAANYRDSHGKNKHSDKSRRKGTPGILKQDRLLTKNSNREKKSNFTTPRKRYSKILTATDSIKVVERKRKKVSVYSSDSNSTLRPKAKRFKSVSSIPSENEPKVILKNSNSLRCKGTMDSQASCTNSVDFSANTTDASSACMETPKSTFSNRRGNVRVIHKRNLFSTPRNRAKKKWLK